MVPIAELALAFLLLLATNFIGLGASVVALLLFAFFTVLVWREVRRGRSFDCGCFGAYSRSPIDALTVARNLGFTLLSALSAARGPNTDSFVSALLTGGFGATCTWLIAILICTAAAATIIRQRRHIWALRTFANRAADSKHLSETAVREGGHVPEVEVVSRELNVYTLNTIAKDRATLVFFVKVGCGGCRRVAEAWAAWRKDLFGNVQMISITSSRESDVEETYAALASDTYYGSTSARLALGIRVLPSAILLGSNGVVATPVAEGYDEIAALVAGTLNAVVERDRQ